MEELKAELKLEEFIEAVKELGKGLGPEEKSVLYNYKYTGREKEKGKVLLKP